MRILGLTDGQSSGAAVIEDGRILAAVNEERIVRIKLARGFPWKAIEDVLRLSNTAAHEIKAVAVANVNMEFREKVADWPGWFEARGEDADLHSAFFNAAARYGHLAAGVPALKRVYYALRTPVYASRRRRIQQILSKEYGIDAPIRFVEHHYAHATSAYFTGNFDEALVVTMDGGGDRHCSHVYSVKNGVFEKLNVVEAYNSLGNYYAYITAVCGFKAQRHEGKITGLAARGRPIYRDFLESMIAYENGQLVNHGKVLFTRALEKIKQDLPAGWTREDLSASIQVLSEDIARRYVGYWAERTGHRNVALAGGLFANVRINEEIHALPSVDNIFVHPGMSDEGLAVGAALAVQGEHDRKQGKPYQPRELETVYLGNSYDDAAIADAVRQSGLTASRFPGAVEAEIGAKLAQGKVVARFNGRMEYGPRALGNRSILYQPGDPSVNDWLNELLRRTEFMPFAPSSLHEHSSELYENVKGAEDSARFMTITFHCTPSMIKRCGGVVHVDNTARPQLVRNRITNPIIKLSMNTINVRLFASSSTRLSTFMKNRSYGLRMMPSAPFLTALSTTWPSAISSSRGRSAARPRGENGRAKASGDRRGIW